MLGAVGRSLLRPAVTGPFVLGRVWGACPQKSGSGSDDSRKILRDHEKVLCLKSHFGIVISKKLKNNQGGGAHFCTPLYRSGEKGWTRMNSGRRSMKNRNRLTVGAHLRKSLNAFDDDK